MTKALVAPIKAMGVSMTLPLLAVLVLSTLPSLTQAAKAGRLFSTSILRCPGAKRCGLFSVTMHSGRAGTSECKVSCVFLPMLQARAKTCGGCGDEDGLVPLVPTTPQPVAPVAPSTASPVAPTAPVNPATSYNIDIQFVGDPLSDKAFFVNATKKWQSVIVGDKPSFDTTGFKAKEAGCVYPSTVEDLFICCVYKFIDGDQLVVGIAGPDVNRPDGTAALGTMTFDTSDITLLKNSNSLVETILHEMGHVIGLGVYWDDKGVAGSVANKCPYTGVNANREYKAVSGCNSVPLEQEAAKGQCSHWDEECLVNELMTGILLRGSTPLLSKITVGSLQDLGYEVDYTKADAYTSANLGAGCTCKARTRQRRDKERSMTDMAHGETIALGGLRNGQFLDRASSPVRDQRRPTISAAAHQLAVDYGKRHLAERAAAHQRDRHLLSKDWQGVYVGDQVVSVLVHDAGEIYGVIVHK